MRIERGSRRGEADKRQLRLAIDPRLMLRFRGSAVPLASPCEKADQDRPQGRKPRPLRHIPNDRRRGVAAGVARNDDAVCPAAGSARTGMTGRGGGASGATVPQGAPPPWKDKQVASTSATASAALGWIGRFVRKLIEGPVGTVVRFLSPEHNVLNVLERRAVHDSADYIAATMPGAAALRSREALWDYAIRNAERHGLWLELGVFKGYSINYPARRTDERVFGFDSLRGLQEDWKSVGHTRGIFDLAGHLPRMRSNVSLVAGWFSDTLPGFLATNRSPCLSCTLIATL